MAGLPGPDSMGGDFNFPRSDRPPGSNEPIRARGARYWTVKGYLEYAKNDPEYFEKSLKRRIAESNARSARELRRKLADEARLRGRHHMVGGSGRRLTSQGESIPANRSYIDSGDPPPTRKGRGKGRSFAVRDWTTPALDDRHGAPSRQRISGLFGDSSGKGNRSATAIFSNFAANRDLSSHPLGASAGRMRGFVNFMRHPETFAGRFLWIYAAQQTTRAISEWRSWDKVSWTMSDRQAQAVLDRENTVDKQITKAGQIVGRLGGTVLRGVGEIGFGLMAAAQMSPIPNILGSAFSEADLARGMSNLNAWSDYLSAGSKGMNPWAAGQTLNLSAGNMIEDRQRKIDARIRRQLTQGVEKNLTISQNDKRVLAVGGVDTLLRAISSSPEFEDRLRYEINEARVKDAPAAELQEALLNKLMGVSK